MSFRLDALFFRNITLLLSAIFIWTGVEHILSYYFLTESPVKNGMIVIAIGVILLFIFDSEVENEDSEKLSDKWIKR